MWTEKLFGSKIPTESHARVEAGLYRSLAENSLGLMCCHDLNGILLWINPAAASSLGYNVEEAVGEPLGNYLVPEVRALFASYLERMRCCGTDKGFMRLRAKKGDERIWMYRNVVSDDPELTGVVLGHAIDVTEQFRIQHAFKEWFEHSPVGQMELDAEGNLLRINPAACEIFGRSEAELLSGPGPSPARDFFREMVSPGEDRRLIIIPRNDGPVLHLEVHVRRLSDSTLSPRGLSCALIDVSERVRAETNIQLMNAQLEARVAARTAELRQSNAELEEFASVASHDLQAPLKQIGKALDKIATQIGEGETLQLLQQTQTDIQRMAMLTDSLLSYARASNRADSLSPDVPLEVAVEESLMNLASTIGSSEAIVSYGNLPHILVNESQFVQVFQNLIGNAIKYRSQKPPRIQISAIETEELWTVSVEDNGIGIDPVYSERIFKPFQRLHGKEYTGSGLGLTICKRIIERAGGQIWVESKPGEGSKFRFTILA